MVVKCPKCNQEIGKQTICNFCKIDINLYKRIKQISKKMYNQGLEQAQYRDLSGAIESLQRSLFFDKRNIQARNLLGLVYYEVGQIGFALKHWVLSSNFQKENNEALTYIQTIQNDKKTLERKNEAIKKYNQALQSLQQKSEDIAYIQLKSVVGLHPQFVEAHTLLALCSIMNHEPERALESIEKVLSIDANHPLALRYYQYLQPNKIRPAIIEKSNIKNQTPKRQYSRQLYQQSKQKNRYSWNAFSSIGLFITGAICMLAVVYILIIPNKVNQLKHEISQLQQKVEQEQQMTNQKIADYQNQVDQLQKENSDLKQVNQTLETEQRRLDETQKVQQITLLLQQNKIEEAAPLIYALNDSWLSTEQQQMRQKWIQDIYPKAAKTFYDQGIRAYNQGRNDATQYEKALYLFEQSLAYAKDQYFSDDALYFTGVIHEIGQDLQKAIEVYERLLEEYPSTNQKYNAQKRLNRLKQS